jgi:hypothetical protein
MPGQDTGTVVLHGTTQDVVPNNGVLPQINQFIESLIINFFKV